MASPLKAGEMSNSAGVTLVISGLVDDWRVQQCRAIAAEICSVNAENDYEVRTMLETDWEKFLARAACEVDGFCTSHSKSPLVLLRLNGCYSYVGDAEQLEALAAQELGRPPCAHDKKELEKTARALCLENFRRLHRQFAFLDVRFNAGTSNSKPKKIVIELFTDVCPKTCDNFLALCRGERGDHEESRLHYRDTLFHHVVAGGWVQAGEVHGVDQFADESFAVSFDRPGIVAMANTGPHTNASQFFITLNALPWLNKTAVAFGAVIKGIAVVRQIGRLQTEQGRPIEQCVILSCGAVDLCDGFGL